MVHRLNEISDLLDFFITRKVSSNFAEIDENFDMDSDHLIAKSEGRLSFTNKTADWNNFTRLTMAMELLVIQIQFLAISIVVTILMSHGSG